MVEGITPRQKVTSVTTQGNPKACPSHRSTVDAAAGESDDYAKSMEAIIRDSGKRHPNATLECGNEMLPVRARTGLL